MTVDRSATVGFVISGCLMAADTSGFSLCSTLSTRKPVSESCTSLRCYTPLFKQGASQLPATPIPCHHPQANAHQPLKETTPRYYRDFQICCRGVSMRAVATLPVHVATSKTHLESTSAGNWDLPSVCHLLRLIHAVANATLKPKWVFNKSLACRGFVQSSGSSSPAQSTGPWSRTWDSPSAL